MGVSRSGRELSAKLAAIGNDFGDLPYKQVEEASLIVKRSVLRLAPNRLRNVGRRGSRLNARYNIGKYEGAAKALVYATGAWQIIERDTKAHTIPRQRKRGGKVRVALVPGAVGANGPRDRGMRMNIQHPGTKGKHPWRRGVDMAMPQAGRVLRSSTSFVLSKHL